MLNKQLIYFVLEFAIAASCSSLSCALDTRVELFNGHDMNHWEILEGKRYQPDDTGSNKALFAVENGMLHVYPTQKDGSTQDFAVLITKKSFKNYQLTLEYKWGKKKFKPRNSAVRDAGVIFHVCSRSVFWPHGMECQIQEGDTGDIWALGTRVSSKVSDHVRNYDPKGSLQTRGKRNHYGRFHRSYCWEKSDWNKLQITVSKDHATFILNEHLVNEAIDMRRWDDETSSWKPLIAGPIALQAEGAELFYRRIYLKLIR